MEKGESLGGNFIEYEIRRKGWPQRVSKEKEVQDGFVISGPELNAGEIRLSEGNEDAFSAETPWGRMSVRGLGHGNTGHWTVTNAAKSTVSFDLKRGSYLDLSLSKDVKLRFRNRSFFVHKYRFDDKSGLIEIRTETKGPLRGGPFPNEWKKTWKIEFAGQLSVDKSEVLPPLALFLCFVKTAWPYRFDEMF